MSPRISIRWNGYYTQGKLSQAFQLPTTLQCRWWCAPASLRLIHVSFAGDKCEHDSRTHFANAAAALTRRRNKLVKSYGTPLNVLS
ncbi:hypothetical protein E2C01_056390 [Portunus trituberculatus]|uniref:Uncharacterized protein n=1 Tax=Portunus trituberculatus TaxID=210409 RepID=A0A5B7GXK1_PORTR|nr:hypothetical protein [Portunus trituberculatus]